MHLSLYINNLAKIYVSEQHLSVSALSITAVNDTFINILSNVLILIFQATFMMVFVYIGKLLRHYNPIIAPINTLNNHVSFSCVVCPVDMLSSA